MPTPQQQDSLKALLNNQSLSGSYGRTSDLLAQDTDAYGNYDPRGGQAYTAATEAGLVEDPWTQHYEDMGDAQSQEALYDRPGQQQQRDDALMRTLAPIRAEASYDQQAGQMEADAVESRFRRSQDTQRRGQDIGQMKAGGTQAGQAQRQRNTQLESQAKAAQGTTRSPWGWLTGQPSGEDQAATLRSQQQFTQPETGMEQEDQVSDNPQVGETGIIQGTPVEWDGVGWAVIE